MMDFALDTDEFCARWMPIGPYRPATARTMIPEVMRLPSGMILEVKEDREARKAVAG